MRDINNGVYIVTETAGGRLNKIHVDGIAELLEDWNGNRDFCPTDAAKVYFAAIDGQTINPYQYTDFGSLICLLEELQRADEQCAEKLTDSDDLIPIYKRDPDWIKFTEKWGDAVEVDLMDGETAEEYMNDLYDVYEKSGFVPFFQASDYGRTHNGERFKIVSRVNIGDPGWNIESLPAWNIVFEDGTEYYAFPDEICFADVFPYCEKELIPVLSEKLEYVNTEFGGVDTPNAETVMDFILGCDDGVVTDLETLNISLVACFFKPLDLANLYYVTDIEYATDDEAVDLPVEMLVNVGEEDGDLVEAINEHICCETGFLPTNFYVRNLGE